MIIIEALAEFLAEACDQPYGVSCFSYEMPDAPDECIAVEGINFESSRPTASWMADARINATTQNFRVVCRAESNARASRLALLAYQSFMEDDGFITLDGTQVSSYVYSEPVWQKSDQQGRKTFCFNVAITTARPSCD